MKRSDSWKVVPPDSGQHGDRVYDLLSKVFPDPEDGYFGSLHWCHKIIGCPGSHFDWGASRVAMMGDELVANYSVWDYRMRVGKARVRVGGIGCVATHMDCRKRGIQASTARASIEAMRQAGYDMTILFGIPDFYHRLGYVRAWSDTAYEAPVKELRANAPAPALKRFNLAQSDEAHRLYNRTHARLTGTAMRPTYRQMWSKHIRALRWNDRSGSMLGYVRVRPRDGTGPLRCYEVVGDTDQALATLVKLARRDGSLQVRFETLPHEHPLLVRLRRGTCKAETQYRRCGDAMIRTLNLRTTLEKMRGELALRLKASPYDRWSGDLLIADAWERVTLAIRRRRLSVVPPRATRHAIRGREQVAQLLMGTDDPMEIVAASGMRLAGDARKLIGVLFPNQYPMLSGWDRY